MSYFVIEKTKKKKETTKTKTKQTKIRHKLRRGRPSIRGKEKKKADFAPTSTKEKTYQNKSNERRRDKITQKERRRGK